MILLVFDGNIKNALRLQSALKSRCSVLLILLCPCAVCYHKADDYNQHYGSCQFGFRYPHNMPPFSFVFLLMVAHYMDYNKYANVQITISHIHIGRLLPRFLAGFVRAGFSPVREL